MAEYIPTVPPGSAVRADIKDYFTQFYQITDREECLQQYADQFTKDAKLVMGSMEVNGHEEILKMRQGMWTKVAKRFHKPGKLYSFGEGSDEVMLFGTVDYELKDGRKTVVDWAGRGHFTTVEGSIKMDSYQVYLDSAAMDRAK